MWLCVLVLGFQLRPATAGLGVGVCVCLFARSACSPPLSAGLCGVTVCASAGVSAAPRHSWLGCWGACVFLCALCLYPATPGSGEPCGCVCLGSGFGWVPPLLAGLLVCVCVYVPPPLVSRHSWLRCAEWVCVLRLGLRLHPATPGPGVGVCMCLCARSACTPPILAGVYRVAVCAWAHVSAAPRHSRLGRLGVCVFVCTFGLYPANPGWDVRCGCVCLGSGCTCAPPVLAGLLGCVCVCPRAPLVPRHSWLGSAVWVCVLRLEFRLGPATPGWGVGVCVCLCARPACTLPLLAGVCGVGLCAWARVSSPSPLSPGWGVGVRVYLCARSACTPPLLAWVSRVDVCLWARVAVTPPLLAGLFGCLCVCVPFPRVSRPS